MVNMRKYRWTWAYLILCLAVAYSFFLIVNVAQEREKQRCEASADFRGVVRGVVDNIYVLATSSVPTGKEREKLTDSQEEQLIAYLHRVESFKEESIKNLKAPEYCEQYVE